MALIINTSFTTASLVCTCLYVQNTKINRVSVFSYHREVKCVEGVLSVQTLSENVNVYVIACT